VPGLDDLATAMPAILDAEKAELLRQPTALRNQLTRPVQTIEQARKGAARLPWTEVVLRLLGSELSVAGIGDALYVSRNTVKTHARDLPQARRHDTSCCGRSGEGASVAVSRRRVNAQ
jgi:DNA-binding NarL/FixJ family response regulator